MYKRVLLAYDGSESGQKALLNCRDIAQWSHSELFLVAIMPVADQRRRRRRYLRQRVGRGNGAAEVSRKSLPTA